MFDKPTLIRMRIAGDSIGVKRITLKSSVEWEKRGNSGNGKKRETGGTGKERKDKMMRRQNM
jgi:hypothetical protein